MTIPRLALARTAVFVLLSVFIALMNTKYVGEHTIYSGESREVRLRFHQNLLTNTAPPNGWGAVGANGTNIRVGVVYVADAVSRLSGIDVLKVYRLLDLTFLSVLLVGLGLYLKRLTDPGMALIGYLYVAAMLPLTYEFHAFHPWDRVSWVLWLIGIWFCYTDRPVLLGLTVVVGVVVKYDIVVLPLLYALTHLRRTAYVRPLLVTGLTTTVGLAVYVTLLINIPGGNEPRGVLTQLSRNLSQFLESPLIYPPVMVFAIPIGLAVLGWRNADRFARASSAMAALTAVPLVALTNFQEIRAEVMLLLLLLPCALVGLTRLLERPRADKPVQI